MFQAVRGQHLPIGIDFGFDGVKMLQLHRGAGGLAVTAAARQGVTGDAGRQPNERLAGLTAVVSQLLKRNAFRGREAVVALPREMITVKNLRLPLIPEAELQAAIRFEAESLFSAPADSLQLRHIAAGEVRHGNDTKQEVIVMAADREKIDALVGQLHQAGLVLDALDFEPVAAYRGVGRTLRRRDDDLDVNVLVDVGWRQTQVTIGRGRDISFYKTIDLAGRHLNDAVARRLGLDPEEARSLRWRFAADNLTPIDDAPRDPVKQAVVESTRQLLGDIAREIGLCLRYHSVTFRGQRAARVRLTGGESADLNLRQALAAALPIPVEPFDPMAGLLAAPNLNQPGAGSAGGAWATAFGLCVRRLKAQDADATEPRAARRADDVSRVEVVDFGAAVQHAAVQNAAVRPVEPVTRGAAVPEVARA